MLEVANRLVKSFGFNVPVIEGTGDYLGAFNKREYAIKLNIEAIRQTHEEFKDRFEYTNPIEKLFILVLVHEIGHYLDNEFLEDLIELRDNMLDTISEDEILNDDCYNLILSRVVEGLLKSEYTAWENGKKYVAPIHAFDFDIMNEGNIILKRQKYSKEISEILNAKKDLVSVRKRIKELEG